MTTRVLIVEDEAGIRLALTGLLRREGYEVIQCERGDDALARLGAEAFDFVLTDLALGTGPSGLDVLRLTKERQPETPVVMITAHGNEKIAVEAMKLGADDYVPKPFDNDEIRLVVRRALERTRLARENRELRARIERDFGMGNLVGRGAAMRHVFETIRKVAETDLSVLVRGESGTGKELVAQALHEASARRSAPFVAVNCAAISRELVESELFGHEKGAFTGADARRIGRFESAHGGSIFLDEIGDMAPDTQAKVLRVLQERTFERVGGAKPIQVDVRVVAATHRDLEKEVATGRFREDLYYRLKVVEIPLPALRERPEDLPALAERFLVQVAERLGRARKRLTPDALAALTRHAWPGNVRELRNALE
ncbi:MAG: sigma-54-dependent transcriptional regulator, partial [Myxococcota bacterium]